MNHFIELDRDDDGYLYLVIHTGSRNLGVQIAKHYQTLADKATHEGSHKEQIQELIRKLKEEGRLREIQQAIEDFNRTHPMDKSILGYCQGNLLERYIHDIEIAQSYALANHMAIMDEITKAMAFHLDGIFHTMHNYIDTDAMILRKGAVQAHKGQKLIIPMNMRDGSLICTGKGNPDWNESAPHGAGRIMSRAAARKNLTMEAFNASMNGIYTTSVSIETIDEAPMAYKPMDEIVSNIGDTVSIDKVIRPIYNFKAGGEG